MKNVLLVAFAAITLAACAELPSAEESSPMATVDEVTAVESAEVPPSANNEREVTISGAAENSQSTELADTAPTNDEAAERDSGVQSNSISQQLLALIGAESPEEVYQSLEKQRRLMFIMIDRTFQEDARIMREIARCESPNRSFRHWEANGELVPNDEGASSARGAFQVLVGLHAPDIERLEHVNDMHNIEDYMAFVRYLYKRAGSRNWSQRFSDWYESRSCWETRLASR